MSHLAHKKNKSTKNSSAANVPDFVADPYFTVFFNDNSSGQAAHCLLRINLEDIPRSIFRLFIAQGQGLIVKCIPFWDWNIFQCGGETVFMLYGSRVCVASGMSLLGSCARVCVYVWCFSFRSKGAYGIVVCLALSVTNCCRCIRPFFWCPPF